MQAEALVGGQQFGLRWSRSTGPDASGNGVGDERGEEMGRRFGVAALSDDAERPSGGDGTEEVIEVNVDDDGSAGVVPVVGDRRSGFAEAVSGGVRGYAVEDLAEHDALEVLSRGLGSSFSRAPCYGWRTCRWQRDR